MWEELRGNAAGVANVTNDAACWDGRDIQQAGRPKGATMRTDWIHGMVGMMAIGLAAVAYGQQSTRPPATDHAPAAPGATSASATTDTAAPAAGITSGPSAATGAVDDRPNEQSAAAASPASTTATSSGTFPAPMPPTTSPPDQKLGSGTGAAGSAQGGAQRGELGVWMVETGGPGVEIRMVTEGSAAERFGLQPGDVILSINGRGADSPQAVAQLIRQMQAGQSAALELWRDGQTSELNIVLQPAREQYEVGFRGDDALRGMSRPNGDLESRVMRLEQQLATVLQELRQLRQLHHSGSAQTRIGGAGTGETSTATGFDASSTTTTTGAATAAGATEAALEPAATEAVPAENATTPETAPTESGSDDLFE